MNMPKNDQIKWSENIILADADYVDHVAFDLTVNFERMLERRIPKADLAQWAVCVALDGGLRAGNHETQVVLIHDKKHATMDNFNPSDFEGELDGKAFRDAQLGEFIVSSYPTEYVVDKSQFFLDIVKVVMGQESVKRVMLIPDTENGDTYDELRTLLKDADDEKRITVFGMQPLQGGNFRQEVLGYSIMSAMGIRAEEFK